MLFIFVSILLYYLVSVPLITVKPAFISLNFLHVYSSFLCWKQSKPSKCTFSIVLGRGLVMVLLIYLVQFCLSNKKRRRSKRVIKKENSNLFCSQMFSVVCHCLCLIDSSWKVGKMSVWHQGTLNRPAPLWADSLKVSHFFSKENTGLVMNRADVSSAADTNEREKTVYLSSTSRKDHSSIPVL